MAGLDPAIHAFDFAQCEKTWTPGKPGMTTDHTRFIVTETFGPFLMVW
jgi:hypothetical protein